MRFDLCYQTIYLIPQASPRQISGDDSLLVFDLVLDEVANRHVGREALLAP
jgi:hypothetical protein